MSADPSLDIDMLIVAGVAGLFSAAAWISSVRNRREQARTSREKAEDEAFLRIEAMYTTALKTQGDELSIANNRIAEQNKKIHELEEMLTSLRGERYGDFKRGSEPS